MVLNCDVCRQNVTSTGGQNPTICLFPCFHKYCDQCKNQVFNAARQQPNNNGDHVACKICNQSFPFNVLYDHSENQIDKIFCLHCNIKNKAPVEWRCKSCQNRFLCTQCSQPHYHSGHEIEPVMKNIPLRSQCSTHLNLAATYLCSCQTRLCNFCFNEHANGQTMHPHEQRIPYVKLAEQSRIELDNIRKQSQIDTQRVQINKDTIAKNKQLTHTQASQARTAVANEVMEIVNAVIRRGNDIVTYIDFMEESKLKNYSQMEQEMRHWLDRLKKIESFTENALLTIQQDNPGMWSAAMFAQSALSQVNKRRDVAKPTLRNMERTPNITYHSDLTNVINAIRSVGIVNVDGEQKIPAQSTPQSARMFTIANAAQMNPSSSGNIPGGATVSQGQQNILLERPTLTLNMRSQPIQNSTSLNLSATVPLHQKGQTILPRNPHRPAAPIQPMQIQSPIRTPLSSNINHQPQPNRILPQLLQSNAVIQPTYGLSQSYPNSSSSNSIPNTPLTPSLPIPTPEQLQIMRHNTMLSTQQQQQASLPTMMPAAAGSLQNHQSTMLIHQQQQQKQMAALIHNQQHQQAQQPNQRQQLHPPSTSTMNQQQQLQNMQMLHLQQLQIAQQMHQQRLQQSVALQPQTSPVIQQQQMVMNQQSQRLSSPLQQQLQNPSTSDGQSERHPILLRIPNPRQQISQPDINSASAITTPTSNSRMNTPPNVTLARMLNIPPQQKPSAHTSESHPPPMQQQYLQVDKNQLNVQQVPPAPPEVVELMDEDDNDSLRLHQPFEGNNEEQTQNLGMLTMVDNCKEDGQLPQSNFNNSNHQNQSTIIPPHRQKEKAQCAAADSTVTSTSTPNNGSNDPRESVSPADVPMSSISQENINKTKRKCKLEDEHPPDKRKLFDVEKQNLVHGDSERTNKNTSPVIISTTTAENGETTITELVAEEGNDSLEPINLSPIDKTLIDHQISIKEANSINQTDKGLHDTDHKVQTKITQKNANLPALQIRINETPQPVHIGIVLPSSQEAHQSLPKNDGTNNSTNQKQILDTSQQKLKTPTKCAIVSPIQLMKMTNNSSTSYSPQTIDNRTNKPEVTIDPTPSANDMKSTSTSVDVDSPNSDRRLRVMSGADDMWDDYCYVCSQGCDEYTGSLGCCENCPHVFHARCHVPKIDGLMEDLPDDWRCSICVPCDPITQIGEGFGGREQLLCAKVYLACFEENNQVELFLNKVPTTEMDYYSIIKRPIWLYAISEKVSSQQYKNVSEFVDDMNLLFQNFSAFNPPNNSLASTGKNVYTRYVNGMRKYLPAYQKQIWLYVSLYNSHTRHTGTSNLPSDNEVSKRPGRRLRRGMMKSKSQTPG